MNNQMTQIVRSQAPHSSHYEPGCDCMLRNADSVILENLENVCNVLRMDFSPNENLDKWQHIPHRGYEYNS